jgi:hypothetical protein
MSSLHCQEMFVPFQDKERFGPVTFWFMSQQQVDNYFQSRKDHLHHFVGTRTRVGIPATVLDIVFDYLGPPKQSAAASGDDASFLKFKSCNIEMF